MWVPGGGKITTALRTVEVETLPPANHMRPKDIPVNVWVQKFQRFAKAGMQSSHGMSNPAKNRDKFR
jgi:hypothetical protein